MLERLFPRWSAPAEKPLPQPDAQLALGALLVRVAFADRTYRPEEIAVIDKILSASFGLKPLEAAKLRASCEDLERHAADTDEFTTILQNEVPYVERQGLAHAMWQVVMADGVRRDIEEDALHQIEAALGLSEDDSKAARDTALGS